MNNWNITGTLGADAEVSATKSGKTICSFSVAVKSGYGESEKTTWAKCMLFGKRAEGGLPQYLVKGQKVALTGELCLDEWEGKYGTKQKTLKVSVNSLDLIGDKKSSISQAASENKSSSVSDDNFEDDIPF